MLIREQKNCDSEITINQYNYLKPHQRPLILQNIGAWIRGIQTEYFIHSFYCCVFPLYSSISFPYYICSHIVLEYIQWSEYATTSSGMNFLRLKHHVLNSLRKLGPVFNWVLENAVEYWCGWISHAKPNLSPIYGCVTYTGTVMVRALVNIKTEQHFQYRMPRIVRPCRRRYSKEIVSICGTVISVGCLSNICTVGI